MREKLHKIIAQSGLTSRREAERWIAQGRVRVNQSIAQVGDRVGPSDEIVIDGQRFKWPKVASQIIVYHKPVGLVCSHSDEKGRDTIFSQIPDCDSGKWIYIGRLDINSSGLLLLTNNGQWANHLMHPSHHLEREYLVRVDEALSFESLSRLKAGIELNDGLARVKRIKLMKKSSEGRNKWYRVVIMQGRHRVVRRLFEALDRRVSRLIRVRFGNLDLPKHLAPGQFMPVDIADIGFDIL